MSQPMLQSEHVVLAPLTQADAPVLYGWINDRATAICNGPYRPIGEAEHRNWFAAIQQRQDVVIFGIRRRDDDALIGSCQLHSIHPVHRTAELQIRIGQVDQRSQGLGTEGVRLLLRFAFLDLNLERVHLHVFADNTAALRVYQRVGFVEEGRLRQHAYVDGQRRDVVMMGILRQEFLSRPLELQG
jgi:RimJ/RimL family protein N-acetyltransferase